MYFKRDTFFFFFFWCSVVLLDDLVSLSIPNSSQDGVAEDWSAVWGVFNGIFSWMCSSVWLIRGSARLVLAGRGEEEPTVQVGRREEQLQLILVIQWRASPGTFLSKTGVTGRGWAVREDWESPKFRFTCTLVELCPWAHPGTAQLKIWENGKDCISLI